MAKKIKLNKWRSAIIVTFSVALLFALTKLYSMFLAPLLDPHVSDLASSLLSSMLVPYGIALPIACLFLIKVKATSIETRTIPLSRFFYLAIVQSGLSMLAIFLVSSAFIIAGNKKQMSVPSWGGAELLFYAFLLLVFNPIVEEFVFRKLVLERLLEYGNKWAILLSAVLFAVPHTFSQGLSQLASAFVLGIIWATIYVKTNKLHYIILLHVFANFWGMFLPIFIMKTSVGHIVYPLIWIGIVPVSALILLLINRKNPLLLD